LKSSNAPRPYLYVFRRIRSISIALEPFTSANSTLYRPFGRDSSSYVCRGIISIRIGSMPRVPLIPVHHYNPKLAAVM